MAVYKRGKFYHYRFMVNGDNYRGTTQQTVLAKAKHYESTILAQVMAGTIDPRLRKSPILREFSGSFLTHIDKITAAGQLDRKTKATYHNGWRLLSSTKVAGMRMDRIGTSDAAELIFPGSPSNANQALRTLRRILSYACEVGALRAAPKINLREEWGRDSVIEPWVEELLLEYAPEDLADVIVIMLDCGMRPEEVCRMRWENIRWNENAILVPDGKSLQARRFVGMTERMRDRLEAARKRNMAAAVKAKRDDPPWVFPSSRADAGHTVNFNKAWTKLIRKVKAQIIKRKLPALPADLVLYCARHTYATNFLAESGDLAKLMQLLGHASITTTQKYLHPSTGDAAEVMNRHNRRKAGLHIVRSA